MTIHTTRRIPLLPLRGLHVFPKMILHLDVGREASVQALEKTMLNDQEIFLVAQIKGEIDNPSEDEIYHIGTIAYIKQMIKLPNDTFRVLVEGKQRAEIVSFISKDPYYEVEINELVDEYGKEHEVKAYQRLVLEQFEQYVEISQRISHDSLLVLQDIEDASEFADTVTSYLTLDLSDKQKLLETTSILHRLQKLLDLLVDEKKVLKLEKDIAERVKTSMEQTQKEYYLREQLKAIQLELGEADGKTGDVVDLRKQIEASDMPENIEKVALKELSRFERIPQTSAESSVIRNYIEWLIDLPWKEKTEDIIDLEKAKEDLDKDHYGLEKVKERILEYLAVTKLTKEIRGPILCFVGPPGVGKTSLARSIAKTMQRKYVRIALGGIRDEAEIRGHRRTYIGAMPGRIIQGMKRAKTTNPVFLLDEIDKMSHDFRGDPSSAMLEVLDPEQNHSFSDHFIEEEYDLSNVMFIATANYINQIPAPLLDRMELIRLSGYTELEKKQIAKEHLLPKQIKENGLTREKIQLRNEAMLKLIREYTKEAGVRNLERKLGKLCRKAAKQIVNKERKRIYITENNLENYLGKPLYRYGVREEEDQIGAATGLAYTEVGGDILSIEVTYYPGEGKLVLTGKLGDVMQESAQAALSYVKSRTEILEINQDFYKNHDIHIHVPEGATPKDGPSAGITMATALVSSLTNRPVKKEVGMTGEITLRGRVLPIGGLKEKSLSAHRSGLKTILYPKENEKDLDEIPKSIKDELTFIAVDHLDDVLKYALVGEEDEN